MKLTGAAILVSRGMKVLQAAPAAYPNRSATEGFRVGLAKRGTRRIVVAEVAYRWVVSPDDGYMVLVAELADAPGQRLEAFFHYHDVYEPQEAGVRRVVGQRRAIRPGVVRAVIEAALARGWQPSQRGRPAFRVHDAEQVAPVGEVPDAEPLS